MLFEELEALTRRLTGKRQCSYTEFEAINAVYMDSDTMTKQEAAELWRTRYVRARKPHPPKTYAQVQRNNVTPAQFNAACRAALRKAGLVGWLDFINPDLLTNNDGNISHNARDGYDHDEIYRVLPGDVQFYAKPSPAYAKEILEKFGEKPVGYNFTYEFEFDDDKTGHGYCFVTEF